MMVALRGPITAVRKETLGSMKKLKGAVPVPEVPAGIAIKVNRLTPAGLTVRSVQIIGVPVQQNEGIADVDFIIIHRYTSFLPLSGNIGRHMDCLPIASY